MPPAARVTDMHVCPMVTPGTPPVPHVGGPILPPCSPNVITGFMPQARVTDMCTCVGPPDAILKGSPTVLVNGLMAARIGDPTIHGGSITTGFPTVLIGESGSGASPNISAMSLSVASPKALSSAERVASVASRVSAEAAAAEPKITANMQALAAENNAELVGLDYRLKTPESLQRKLMTDVVNEGIEPEMAAERLSDSVRYTFAADGDNLAGTTLSVLESLEAQGYTIKKIKNTWTTPDAPYKGINVQLVSPEGQPLEVQFHTPESFAAKQQTHSLYEAARAPGVSDAEKAVFMQRQAEISRQLKTPKSISSVKPRP